MERWPTRTRTTLAVSVLALTLIALGCSGRTPDPITEIRRQAEQGSAEAQMRLGFMYKSGRWVPQDDAEAERWFRLAAEQDDPEATRWFRLAIEPLPAAELRLAAEQGDPEAQFDLGFMYRNGEGVPQDDAEAVKWYRLAAEQGHADAQYNLGGMYGNGVGVLKDEAEALRWYRLAAEQDDADAQFHLGVMYATGKGVLKDSVLAHMWFSIAGANEKEEARSLSGIAPSKQESTTYEPSPVCKLLILGCRLLIPDRLLENCGTIWNVT